MSRLVTPVMESLEELARMSTTLSTQSWLDASADWLLVPVFEPATLAGPLAELDQATGGVLRRVIDAGDFTGKLASTLPLRGIVGIGAKRMLLLGLGPSESTQPPAIERALLSGLRMLADKANTTVAVALPTDSLNAAVAVRAAATAGLVAGVGQDLYKTERSRFPFAGVQILVPATIIEEVQAALQQGMILGEAVNLTRELVNRPPAEITPASFALRAEQLAHELGLECEVWDQPRLVQERMRSMLAVSQGSPQPPRLVRLTHRGQPGGPTLALVGKGVTFDSGGLSLKPTDGMLTMKCDMAGAATVLGAMTAIARLKLPVNVVGLMGLVENMPGGNAFKLGDILTARNGVTIEVLNTDAEGRLVLADVLSYAVDLGVDRIVDLATLTGACVVALGEEVAGAMANDQVWCDQVLAASKTVGEDLWQLPMFDLYDDLIKGDVGDIKNTGGRWGGAISAAKFLERFVAKKPWVHLDIAGPAFASSAKPYRDAGATGAYVRTLIELARASASL